jgi:hypothetical protein
MRILWVCHGNRIISIYRLFCIGANSAFIHYSQGENNETLKIRISIVWSHHACVAYDIRGHDNELRVSDINPHGLPST